MSKQNKVSYLILDYNKPNESRMCLESIKFNTKFDHKIIYLSNGGDNEYVWNYYKAGLIDQLIVNKENSGLGYGTTDLFRFCDTEYAIYFQNDQFLGRQFNESELDAIIGTLDDKVKSVSIAGNPCNGEYSERGHVIKTSFYNSIENKPQGGAGPYHDREWNEGYVQKHYKQNGYIHYIWTQPLVGDNGVHGVRQNPDGSQWKHRCDTKQLWLVKGPVKEKYVYPRLSEVEWASVLETQSWPDGKIPENELKDSFRVWAD